MRLFQYVYKKIRDVIESPFFPCDLEEYEIE